MKFVTTPLKLVNENGILKAQVSAGADSDNDGIQAAGVKVEFFVDGKEAVQELFSAGLPDWALKLIGQKATPEQVTQIAAASTAQA